jgi:hypothetical protein
LKTLQNQESLWQNKIGWVANLLEVKGQLELYLVVVGIDYDIFFLTCIREELLGSKTDNEVIVTTIDKVWVTNPLLKTSIYNHLYLTTHNKHCLPSRNQPRRCRSIMIDVKVVILFFVPALRGLAQKLKLVGMQTLQRKIRKPLKLKSKKSFNKLR